MNAIEEKKIGKDFCLDNLLKNNSLEQISEEHHPKDQNDTINTLLDH